MSGQYLIIFLNHKIKKVVLFLILSEVKYFLSVLSFQMCNFFFFNNEVCLKKKKKSILIQNVLFFFLQERYYFCLLREEEHPASHTNQERNSLMQNYSSSVNVCPSFKSRLSCTIVICNIRAPEKRQEILKSQLWHIPLVQTRTNPGLSYLQFANNTFGVILDATS